MSLRNLRRVRGMKRDELNSILRDLSDKLGLDSKVKLELRRMKTKAASASIRRNVIRLNKELVEGLRGIA